MGCFAFILPYIEQMAVYSQLQVNWDIRQVSGPEWWTIPANVAASQAHIPIYLCPSDNLDERFSQTVSNRLIVIYTFYCYNSINAIPGHPDWSVGVTFSYPPGSKASD